MAFICKCIIANGLNTLLPVTISQCTLVPLTGVSRDPKYEIWNACMFSVSEGVALVSQVGCVDAVKADYAA